MAIAEQSGDKVLLGQRLTNQGWFLHVTGDGLAAEQPFHRALALEIVGPDHPFTGVATGAPGRAARPLFARQVEAGWAPAAAAD